MTSLKSSYKVPRMTSFLTGPVALCSPKQSTAWNDWSLMADIKSGPNVWLQNTWCEEKSSETLSHCQILTCRVWHPAASSARPCAVLPHPSEEQSHALCAHPLYSPDTWPSHMTRSRTPSPAEGDRLSENTHHAHFGWAFHVSIFF